MGLECLRSRRDRAPWNEDELRTCPSCSPPLTSARRLLTLSPLPGCSPHSIPSPPFPDCSPPSTPSCPLPSQAAHLPPSPQVLPAGNQAGLELPWALLPELSLVQLIKLMAGKAGPHEGGRAVPARGVRGVSWPIPSCLPVNS